MFLGTSSQDIYGNRFRRARFESFMKMIDAVIAEKGHCAILDAGVPFTGHTEFFAERTGTPRVVMMLAGGAEGSPLRVGQSADSWLCMPQ